MRFAPLLAVPLLALAVTCSGETPSERHATDAGVPPPWDDDSARLSRCTFETPPVVAARAATTPGSVRAGYAMRWLDLPVGVPMGGYGARSSALGGKGSGVDGRARRWSATFTPSAGMHSALRADAVAIEAAGEKLVLVRLDLPLVTETTLFEVEKALAADGSMRGHVILTASHSHAAWAAWQASLVLVPGLDRPRRELADRVVAAISGAARDAIAALEPARIGFATGLGLDPDGRVAHDRRSANDDVIGPDGNTAGKDKDPTSWALRLDRADGTPLVALLDVPLHGTVGDENNPLTSTDAPGAVQRSLTSALGYPVLHVQGAAGDVSPSGAQGRGACPDGVRCLDMPRLEDIGAHAVELYAPLVQGIATHAAAALEVVTRSFYVGKSQPVTRPDGTLLYYPPVMDEDLPDGRVFDDAGKLISPLDEFNVKSGAGLCGTIGGNSFGPIDGDRGVGAYSSCADVDKIGTAFAALFHIDSFELPLCDTVRTTSTSVRIAIDGDAEHMIVTVPGEPTAPYTTYLRGRAPFGAERTHVIGYAQDYYGYVLTAEDWLAGDYEASLNIWGPLEGEVVLDGILAAAAIAATPEREDPEAGSSRYTGFAYPAGTPVAPTVTSDHGTVPATLPAQLFLPDTLVVPPTAQPEPAVERARGVARFVWLGGDPAVDFPEVIVEKQTTPGSFAPLTDAHGRPATSRDGVVVVSYTPDPLAWDPPQRHLWAASFQPVPADAYSLAAPAAAAALPLGRYRLTVKGRAQSAAGPVDYTLSSQPFDVVAATLGTSSATRTASGIDVIALLGAAPGLRALREGLSDMDVPLPAPWTATVTFGDATTSTSALTPDALGKAALTLSAAQVAAAVSVEVRDGAGNGGVIPVGG